MSSPSKVIRKAVISEFGDVSKLSVVNGTILPPQKNHVQVAVFYTNFSGADVQIRLGRIPLQRSAPLTPGYCLVGRVVANGPDSTRFAVGTLVAALTVYDAQAERLNLPEKHLIPVPAALDNDDGHQRACALVVDWHTAFAMVRRSAGVRAGQRVFVHGLSGAVGYALLVLCLRAGAQVYGTASARNHAALKELGAAKVFVYTDKAWMGAMKALGGAHAVFDPLGFESWDESYSILTDDGALVGYGANKAALDGDEKPKSALPHIAKLMAQNLKVWSKKRTTFFAIDRDNKDFAADLVSLLDMLEAGEIIVPIKQIWNMETESLRAAHESWGKISGMGSLLIRIASQP